MTTPAPRSAASRLSLLLLFSLVALVAAQRSILDARWMDEGDRASASMREWQQQQTFCFLDNATLRVRIDELNSTLQPHVIRSVSHLREANAVFEATTAALAYVEKLAWPLRPFFWAWSELRVVVDSAHREQLKFSFARSPGALCKATLKGVEAAPLLTEWVSETTAQNVQTVLRFVSSVVCEQCVHGCSLECTPIAGDEEKFGSNACMLELSPYHAPCITVTGPEQPFLSTSPPSLRFSIAFYTYLSSVYAQNFFSGLLIFYMSDRLGRSRAFHYFLGAAMGVCFSALLALYLFHRQTRSATKLIPGAQLLQSVGSMLSVVVPFTGFVLVPSIYWLAAQTTRYLVYLWDREEVFGIPHLGKIYFLAFALIGCIVMWWNQWGAPAKSDEEPQKPEEIEEIGRLDDDDDLPMTTFQTVLARGLKFMGLTLLFYSTSSTEASLLVVLLVSLTRVFEFIAFVAYFWYHYEKPGRHSKLITKKEFEVQGQSETEKALKQLQEYLKKNPDELDKVREDSEIRLRRFVKGRNHLDVATREAAAAKKRAGGSWCAIQ